MMKNNIYFHLFILSLSLFISSQGISRTSTVGFAFGSPALVGLRATIQEDESPWLFQGEYSNIVLEHNRTNGRLTTFRFDIHRQFTDWEAVKPFYFAGLDYFTGYFNKYTPAISLTAIGFGTGLVMPVREKWSMTAEAGFLVPTQAAKGFEFIGLILNLGLRWTWMSPSEL